MKLEEAERIVKCNGSVAKESADGIRGYWVSYNIEDCCEAARIIIAARDARISELEECFGKNKNDIVEDNDDDLPEPFI